MFSILNEIKNNSHRSTAGVVAVSISSSAFIYILVAMAGYLSFGSNVSGNIISMCTYHSFLYGYSLLLIVLLSDPPSIASTIGRASIVILILFSYPLQCHPCRASVDNILKWRPTRKNPTTLLLSPSSAKRESRSQMSDTRFAVLTSLVLVLSYIVAMSVSSLETVLAYVGSTGSTAISFILPGIFYWKISDPDMKNLPHEIDDDGDDDDEEDLDEWFSSWQARWMRTGAGLLVVWGFLVMAVCLILNIFYSAAH